MIELLLPTIVLSAAASYIGILWYVRRANRLAMEAYAPYFKWMRGRMS